ncbi:MAG: glycine zipper 2TM domain-containing protein [Pseudomonadales bacterium]|nr:glycine zipper 2TM domain-containing protein [Pseudomonadales bacterium]
MRPLNIINKSIITVFLLALAQVGYSQTNVSYDYGTVLSASPITKIISYHEPRQQCWVETVERGGHQEYSATGTILGGVIGAAIGNRVGHKKRNKQVGAVAGALLGASIGNDISRRNAPRHGGYSEQVEKCKVVNEYVEEEQVVGYKVSYRYQGETYTTRTQNHPGDTIKLKLSVTPVE